MDNIKESFQKIQAQAQKDGAKVEMLISGGDKLKIGYSQKQLKSFESTQSQMAGLRVIYGAAQGYAYTENLSDESLLRTYQEAFHNAKTVQNNETGELPLMKAQKVQPMSQLLKNENIAIADKMEVARLLEEKCLQKDSRVQSVPYSEFSETVAHKRILNSEGLDQEFKQSYFSGYAYPLAKEGESSKMSGEGFFVRSFFDINTDVVSEECVRKAVALLGAKQLPTGKYAMVLDRSEVPMILQMIESYFSAKELHEGKSLFEGKLGQKVANEKFHLVDDPFAESGSAVRPFDDEGAISVKTVLIENGVLKNFLTNLEYSVKMKLPHTAHAARSPASQQLIASTNLVMAKGTKTLAELLSAYDKVVYLTNFTAGLHAGFKESTGDFSMPAEGFLYEKGQCVGPVDQFVVSGNVLSLLHDIEEISNEYNKPGSSMICTDILFKPQSFAGA